MGASVSGAQFIPHCPKSPRDMYEDPLPPSVSIQSFILSIQLTSLLDALQLGSHAKEHTNTNIYVSLLAAIVRDDHRF